MILEWSLHFWPCFLSSLKPLQVQQVSADPHGCHSAFQEFLLARTRSICCSSPGPSRHRTNLSWLHYKVKCYCEVIPAGNIKISGPAHNCTERAPEQPKQNNPMFYSVCVLYSYNLWSRPAMAHWVHTNKATQWPREQNNHIARLRVATVAEVGFKIQCKMFSRADWDLGNRSRSCLSNFAFNRWRRMSSLLKAWPWCTTDEDGNCNLKNWNSKGFIK